MILHFQELLKPQTKLLQYVIAQPYSRDVICTMLALNKQVCSVANTLLCYPKVQCKTHPRFHNVCKYLFYEQGVTFKRGYFVMFCG